jgi:hypothetical protein
VCLHVNVYCVIQNSNTIDRCRIKFKEGLAAAMKSVPKVDRVLFCHI